MNIEYDVIHLNKDNPADRDKIDALIQFKNTLKWNLALEALSLWAEWFDRDGSADGGAGYCFFCQTYTYKSNAHEEDCLYLRAEKIVNEARKLEE